MTFLELLDKYNIPYKKPGEHHHTHQGWINLDCPDCSPGQGKYRLGYNLAGNYLSCWVCGYRSMYSVLSSLGMDGNDIRESWKEQDRYEQRQEKPQGKYTPPTGVGVMGRFHRDYLRVRGFDSTSIFMQWGVMGLNQDADYGMRWRLFIPIHYKGEAVSWVTRAISDAQRVRYRGASDEQSKIPIKNLLYGADHVRQAAIIVEGPLDVWAIGMGAIAVLGQHISPARMEHLSRIPTRVICFDDEPEAQRRSKKLADNLSVFPGRTVHVVLETGKDAAAAEKAEIESLRKEFLGDQS